MFGAEHGSNLPSPSKEAQAGRRPSRPPARTWRRRALGARWSAGALLFAAAVGALIWKHCTVFFYSWTDEQIHMYVAHRMTQGAVLYRDIDSARPPLVLFPLAWLMKLGCSPLLAGRALVVGIQLATAGLLLWGGWRLASWRAGALAALLFLTSPEVFARVHYTGIQLVALTASACVLFSLRGQPFRAGLFLGLSLAADQHGLVVGGIVALLTVARRPRDALPFALGALIVCAIVFGGVWAMGGRHLWGSLIGIHIFHFRVGQGVSFPVLGRLHAVDLRARLPVRGRGTCGGSAGARSQTGSERRPSRRRHATCACSFLWWPRTLPSSWLLERGGLPLRRGDRAPADSAGGHGIRCGGGPVAPGRHHPSLASPADILGGRCAFSR